MALMAASLASLRTPLTPPPRPPASTAASNYRRGSARRKSDAETGSGVGPLTPQPELRSQISVHIPIALHNLGCHCYCVFTSERRVGLGI